MDDNLRIILTNYMNLLYSILDNTKDLKEKERKLLMKDYNEVYYLLTKN